MNEKCCKVIIISLILSLVMSIKPTEELSKLIPPLKDSTWNNSIWISVVEAPVITENIHDGSRAADGANWFMTEITNEKDVKSAKWMTTGLGIYELYVNEKIIGQEVLKPGFTHHDKTKRSFTYDITEEFKNKETEINQLAVQVTPGWWGDKIITPSGNQGMIGKKCAFRSVLEITFNDDSVKYYGTNLDDWKAGIAGPVKHAAIFDGEIYDNQIPLGFKTPEKLKKPEENKEFNGEILPTVGAEIYYRYDLTLSPVRTYIWNGVEEETEQQYGKVKITHEYVTGEQITLNPGDTLVVDFGQNSAAVPRFKFSAAKGTLLTCKVSELLNDGKGAKSRGMDGPEGSVHRLNLRIPNEGMYTQYIFAGNSEGETYQPHYTFFGYRFISVTSNQTVTIDKVESIPVTSITQKLETGNIVTGNDLINKLISNTIWGQRSNYLSVPTDCPQRNERLGWTADTQVFAATGSFFAKTKDFFHKWTRDLRDTQTDVGGYPGVAPLAQYGAEPNSMMRVGWADVGIIVPWTIWKQFGDIDIIKENWESMEKFMAHVEETKYDHNALINENGNYQWADWLSYEPLESNSGRAWGPDGKLLPEALDLWNFLLASYWLIDSRLMVDMANVTGGDTKKYIDMVEEAKNYILGKFFNSDGTFKTPILNTMQTPAIFALKNQLFEGEKKENLIKSLRKNFEDHGNCLQTGFLGTSILMSTLTENGMQDIAYEILFQRKNPSWLYSVDNGATTVWERWNSYTMEEGMGPKGMNSFNHYAYGVVCQWIWETAAGIASDKNEPGFKRIIMKPIPDKRLGHINASFMSAAGLIKSSWKFNGDNWTWTFTIPDGAVGIVTLPGEEQSKEYKPGTYTLQKVITS